MDGRHAGTKGEQVLLAKGPGENVLRLRHEYYEAMRYETSEKVDALTGQTVIAMMSANHLDPDLAGEIYVLDGRPPTTQPSRAPRGLLRALMTATRLITRAT